MNLTLIELPIQINYMLESLNEFKWIIHFESFSNYYSVNNLNMHYGVLLLLMLAAGIGVMWFLTIIELLFMLERHVWCMLSLVWHFKTLFVSLLAYIYDKLLGFLSSWFIVGLNDDANQDERNLTLLQCITVHHEIRKSIKSVPTTLCYTSTALFFWSRRAFISNRQVTLPIFAGCIIPFALNLLYENMLYEISDWLVRAHVNHVIYYELLY